MFQQFYIIYKQAIHEAAARWKYYQIDAKLLESYNQKNKCFTVKI